MIIFCFRFPKITFNGTSSSSNVGSCTEANGQGGQNSAFATAILSDDKINIMIHNDFQGFMAHEVSNEEAVNFACSLLREERIV